jgi:hypothetical protein
MSNTRSRPLAARLLATATAALAVASLVGAPLAAQTPTHAYRINGSLADELGGPSLVGLGGTVGAGGYTFGRGQGLALSGALTPSIYSVELAFQLDAVNGYRKVLDFKNRTQDFGFYVQNGFASFVGVGGASTLDPLFAAGTPAHVVLTRDAGSRFTAYVNGVQALSFIDNDGLATFSGPDAIAYLLQDDLSGFEEHGSGFLDYARVYDRALTGEEVAGRFAAGDSPLPGTTPPVSTVPEPSTWMLLATGLVGLAGVTRQRRLRDTI